MDMTGFMSVVGKCFLMWGKITGYSTGSSRLSGREHRDVLDGADGCLWL